jgi:hypothetical protein
VGPAAMRSVRPTAKTARTMVVGVVEFAMMGKSFSCFALCFQVVAEQQGSRMPVIFIEIERPMKYACVSSIWHATYLETIDY